MENSEIVFLIVIGNRKMKEELIKELGNLSAKFMNIMYGRGSVKSNEFLEAMGLIVEQNKVVITSLLKRENGCKALEMLEEKFHFDQPNTGIAFTVPVDKIKY